MDSKMECMRASIEKERFSDSPWTGWISPLERSVLKKKKYLEPPPVAAPTQPANANPHKETGTHGPANQVPAPAPKSSTSVFAEKLQGAIRRED
jgi:hypothetical protein